MKWIYVTFKRDLHRYDHMYKKTKMKYRQQFLKQGDSAIARFKITNGMICLETYKDFPPMALSYHVMIVKQFGKVLKIIS